MTKKKTLFKENYFFNSVNSAIKEYRDSNLKIIFVQHNNNQLKKGNQDWEIDERLDKQENDIIIQKKHGNAFQNSELKKTLSDLSINSITIGGLVSHGCVKTTCLGGLAAGLKTFLLKDGHTNRNKHAEIKISETETELLQRSVLIE